MRGDPWADILGYILQKAEGECLPLCVSLAAGLGGFFKTLSLWTGHLVKHWWGFTPTMRPGSGGENKEWRREQVKCWGWGQEIAPTKEFSKEFTWVKMVFEVQIVHTPTCGYNHLCQRSSQNQLLHIVSLDLPFYTQQPKTKQAVAWQKPGAAWHHSRSMLLAPAVANPRHREKEKERRRRRWPTGSAKLHYCNKIYRL